VKPPSFSYEAPDTVEEALALLSRHGEGAKLLAGGQSLVPMMSFRLARPEVLIDLNGVAGLDGIRVDGDRLRIGGMVRHHALEREVVADPLGRLLAAAARHVGHLPIRMRGTLGGSLAHADPAAEWCLIATTLDAELVLQSERGTRVVGAADFFRSTFMTAIEPDEILREASLPLLGPDASVAFAEFSRRDGDFAMAAVAVALALEGDTIREARIGLGGLGGRPVRAREAEAALAGREATPDAFREAAALAGLHADPMSDIHASGEHRSRVVEVLTRRALESAGLQRSFA
jgi:carbon-monoxide dehydrogenase medium subunit